MPSPWCYETPDDYEAAMERRYHRGEYEDHWDISRTLDEEMDDLIDNENC